MLHMDAAMAAVPEIDEDSRQRLHAYFLHTCFFLVVAQELRESMMQQQQQQQKQQTVQPAPPTAPAGA